MKTVSFHTLGCRLNQSESATAADDLARHGYEVVEFGKPSDVVVINTCAVTGVASQKSRQIVRQARRLQPQATIVVMGCDAGVDASAWKSCGADLIVPHPVSAPLSALLERHFNEWEVAATGMIEDEFRIDGCACGIDRTRANLKVQDGCNFFCTYCIVPYARGPARSRELKDALREARELVLRGYKEIVLTGVNLTTYDSGGADLADLIGEILSIDGDFRIRLGSSEPGDVVPKIVDLMAKERRLCRFLHLPLQYGEDGILAKMGRHYNSLEYKEICDYAYRNVSGVCLGADIIIGFPGETREAFEFCCEYVQSLPLGLMHVFPYSVRPGTEAEKFADRVPNSVVSGRVKKMAAIARQKALAFARSQIGETLQVLVEDDASGWSDNYLNVAVGQGAERNTFVDVKIAWAADARKVGQ